MSGQTRGRIVRFVADMADYERPGSNAAARGKITLISVNPPGCVSTSIEPPCCLTTHASVRTEAGESAEMYALGQEQTFHRATVMSAFAVQLAMSALDQ